MSSEEEAASASSDEAPPKVQPPKKPVQAPPKQTPAKPTSTPLPKQQSLVPQKQLKKPEITQKHAKKDDKKKSEAEVKFLDAEINRISKKSIPQPPPASDDDESGSEDAAPAKVVAPSTDTTKGKNKRKAEEPLEGPEKKKKKKKKKKSNKDPDAPKRQLSSYFLFLNTARELIKEENPDAQQKEIMALAAERWKALSLEDRAPYDAAARVEREKYQVVKQEYDSKKHADSGDEGNGHVAMKIEEHYPLSSPARPQRPKGERVLLVREKGHSHFRRILITTDASFAFLAKKLKKKLENKHDIKSIVQGGRVLVKDNEDVELLEDGAEVEVSFRSAE